MLYKLWEFQLNNMKVKFKNIREFINISNILLNKDSNFQNTKLGYAIVKLVKSIQPILDEINKEYLDLYAKEVEVFEIENALTDKDGAIIFDEEKKIKFSKDGMKKMLEVRKNHQSKEELLTQEINEREYEINPHIVSVYDSSKINMIEAEALKGFVLSEDVNIEDFLETN